MNIANRFYKPYHKYRCRVWNLGLDIVADLLVRLSTSMVNHRDCLSSKMRDSYVIHECHLNIKSGCIISCACPVKSRGLECLNVHLIPPIQISPSALAIPLSDPRNPGLHRVSLHKSIWSEPTPVLSPRHPHQQLYPYPTPFSPPYYSSEHPLASFPRLFPISLLLPQ